MRKHEGVCHSKGEGGGLCTSKDCLRSLLTQETQRKACDQHLPTPSESQSLPPPSFWTSGLQNPKEILRVDIPLPRSLTDTNRLKIQVAQPLYPYTASSSCPCCLTGCQNHGSSGSSPLFPVGCSRRAGKANPGLCGTLKPQAVKLTMSRVPCESIEA